MGIPGWRKFLERRGVAYTHGSLQVLKGDIVVIDGHPLLHAAKCGKGGKAFTQSALRVLSAIALEEAELAAGTRDADGPPLIEQSLTDAEREALVWPFVQVRVVVLRRCRGGKNITHAWLTVPALAAGATPRRRLAEVPAQDGHFGI